MKRLMKFLLGLTLGAALAMLFAPKSGRELRQQLAGSGSSRLLPPASDDYLMPAVEREWDMGSPVAVAEPPAVEESVTVEEAVAVTDEGLVEDSGIVTDSVIVAEPDVVEEPPAYDLRARIEETRSAIAAEIAEPFGERLEPVAEEPVVEEVAEEPVAEEVAEEPVAEEVAEEPVAEEVAEPEPVVEEPVVEEVAEPEPVVEEPVVEEVAEEVAEEVVEPEPVVEEVAEEPVTEEPAVSPEVFEGPVYQEPAAEAEPPVELKVEDAPPEAPRAWDIWQDPLSDDGRVADSGSVAEVEPIAEVAEEVTEEVAESELVIEEAEAEEVAELEPVVEEAAVEEVTEEVAEPEPVAEEVAESEPVAEEPPAAREGGTIDQAEMRRRIEETRARLKAKAFDAMMSGEAALLRKDSGDKPVPKGDEVELEPEIDTTIDNSLQPEDY